jgi:hypothetical protein
VRLWEIFITLISETNDAVSFLRPLAALAASALRFATYEADYHLHSTTHMLWTKSAWFGLMLQEHIMGSACFRPHPIGRRCCKELGYSGSRSHAGPC